MKSMVDVCSGKMRLEHVEKEVRLYFGIYAPTRMTVDIRRKKDGYYTTIWIPKKDFEKEKK